jgi:Tol biopolymer transport system component
VVSIADGASRKLIVGGGHAAWSPDGSSILFARAKQGVYVADGDGTGERLVTENAAQPMWSPDGTLIGFVSLRSGAPQLFVGKPDGSAIRQVTTTVRMVNHPDW